LARCSTMSDRNENDDDGDRRKFLKGVVAGGVVAASVAGYGLLKNPVEARLPVAASLASAANPRDPTFDANGVQLPSLTSDPAHRAGSIYFRSDLGQLRLDDGSSYYTIPKKLVFSKGGVVLSPVAQTLVVWRAPFSCTVTAVKGFQDVGAGSVITACDNGTDLLSTDITISAAATWQDGGSLAHTAVSTGDSIAIKVVSVSGSPNYLVIQVEFTQP
jgi:hypothetical protein